MKIVFNAQLKDRKNFARYGESLTVFVFQMKGLCPPILILANEDMHLKKNPKTGKEEIFFR